MAQRPVEDISVSRDWASARLFPAIVNSSDDAIMGETFDGVIATWNPAAEAIYGYGAAEIIGLPRPCCALQAEKTKARRPWPGSAGASTSRTARLSGGARTAPTSPPR